MSPNLELSCLERLASRSGMPAVWGRPLPRHSGRKAKQFRQGVRLSLDRSASYLVSKCSFDRIGNGSLGARIVFITNLRMYTRPNGFSFSMF